VKGSPAAPAYTCFVTEEVLQAEEAIRLAPAIYQEYVAGGRHIRMHVFGGRTLAVLIESPDMDWRRDLSRVRVSTFDMPPDLERRVRHVIEELGLVMGVVDLKIDEEGEPIWLEVNPQGQFLFVEGLCGAPLTALFARFLARAREPLRGFNPHQDGLTHSASTSRQRSEWPTGPPRRTWRPWPA